MARPSKNQTRSIGKTSGGQHNAPTTFLIPCNQGRNAYVQSAVTGKRPNLAVGSDAFWAAIGENVNAGYRDKLYTELTDLTVRFPDHSWAQVRDQLPAVVEPVTA